MKHLLLSLVSIFFISSCSQKEVNSNDSYIKEDWGKVISTTFVRKTKHSIFYKVVTDKYTFNELDFKDFPNNQIIIGQNIFKQTSLNSSAAHTSLCSDNLCLAHSSCYSWMPCFNEYEQQLITLNSKNN